MEERLASLGFITPRGSPNSAGMLAVSNAGSRNERRSRIVDLEEMMLMEAIRLSLAEEEDRKRREAEAEAKKKREEQQASAPADGKGKSVDRGAGSSSSSAVEHVEDAGVVGRGIPVLGEREESEGAEGIGKGAVVEVGRVGASEEAR